MDNLEKEIIERIKLLKDDIYDYIVNTEHWIFYWIANKEVQDFIKEYPENFEDMIHISILSVDQFCGVKIFFDDHPNEVDSIVRYANLDVFRDSTKTGWIGWNGKIKEMQIAEKEKELAYFKRKVSEMEEEILELKNKE